MTAALEFREVHKQYRSLFRKNVVTALDGFTLAVEPGEIFGFLGPNGAGKTTAIHIALGLMFPDSGSGTMLGKPFGDAVTRKRIGFLAENIAFYNRKAAAAIRYYAELNGMSGAPLAASL